MELLQERPDAGRKPGGISKTLDPEDMDIGVVLDIYRASQNGQDIAGDDELWTTYHDIQNQLSKDVNEYISQKRAEIKEAYDMRDYKAVIRAIANRVATGKQVVNPATGKLEDEFKFVHAGWEKVLKIEVVTERL